MSFIKPGERMRNSATDESKSLASQSEENRNLSDCDALKELPISFDSAQAHESPPTRQSASSLTGPPVSDEKPAAAASSGSWGWGLLNINTSSFYSSMKRDLEELQHHASELASGTVSSVARIIPAAIVEDARKAAEFVRDGVDSVVRTIDETLQINHDQLFGAGGEEKDGNDAGDESLAANNDTDAAVSAGLTRQELAAILNNPDTFTREPRGSDADEYDKWATEQFNLPAMQPRIERLIVDNEHVAKLYEDFVVADHLLTHEEFWLRYFFRVRQASRDKQRRLTQRRSTTSSVATVVDEQDDNKVVSVQPGSSVYDAAINDSMTKTVTNASLENPNATKIPLAVETTDSGPSSRITIIQSGMNESTKVSPKKTSTATDNDDVYSSASTESFALVDRDNNHAAQQLESISGGGDRKPTPPPNTIVTPSSSSVNGSNSSRGDDEEEWEKEF